MENQKTAKDEGKWKKKTTKLQIISITVFSSICIDWRTYYEIIIVESDKVSIQQMLTITKCVKEKQSMASTIEHWILTVNCIVNVNGATPKMREKNKNEKKTEKEKKIKSSFGWNCFRSTHLSEAPHIQLPFSSMISFIHTDTSSMTR